MSAFQNPLSWSITRSTLLYYCQKKYFFSYYWNWLKEFDQTIWLEALTLKNLKSLDMRIGEITHQLISQHLTNIAWDVQIDISTIIKNKIDNIDNLFAHSKHKDYSTYNKTDRFWLSEHFYWQDIDKEFKIWKDKLKFQLENLLNHSLFDQIQHSLKYPNKWFIESNEPDFDKMKFIPDDMPEILWVTLRAQPDFWLIKPNNEYMIFDWKTWKVPATESDTISDQLKVYAYKILSKIWISKFNEIKIHCNEIFLNDMKIFGWELNYSHITQIQDKIAKDITIQKNFILDSDIYKNIPIATHHFLRTNNLKKCQFCTFRKTCNELKNYEPELQETNIIWEIDKIIEEDYPF